MKYEFKPGDKVTRPNLVKVVNSIEPPGFDGNRLIYFTDGTIGLLANFQLVEPTVTHRELRKVLEELTKTTLQNDFNAGWNDALDAFFTQATGEQP